MCGHVLFSDIVIPGTNTATQSSGGGGGGGRNKIPAGETVLVIKTPKGMYIRTNQVCSGTYVHVFGPIRKLKLERHLMILLTWNAYCITKCSN